MTWIAKVMSDGRIIKNPKAARQAQAENVKLQGRIRALEARVADLRQRLDDLGDTRADRLGSILAERHGVPLGRQIAARRSELGLTQDDAAVRCNVARDNLWRYENGKLHPRLDSTLRLSRGLGIAFVIGKERDV